VIAREVGVSAPTCYRDVVEGIAEITREAAEELLALELLRLDNLQCGLYAEATSSDFCECAL
jgi:hypothetical protein